MKIIIPSAKIVPVELQNLGRLPAIVYPVNQRVVFDYLKEQYEDAEYRIVCYEKADMVRKRLSKYKNVEIVELDQLLDLGYSVYKGIDKCSGDGYVNFADTIVADQNSSLSEDAFFYSVDMLSSTWTYFHCENGVITKVVDQKDVKDNIYGNLFVGVFRFAHLEYLRDCLDEALNDNPTDMNSFYYALMLYSRRYKLKPIKTDNWLDVGHQDRYFDTTLEVKAREFNHISIDKDRGILVKHSDDIDKFIGEIKWYLKLPADIEYIRPRIFEYSVSYVNPYISMEYYGYHTLHELFLYGDLTRSQWKSIFSRILFVCNDLKKYTLNDGYIRESLEEMYLKKTIRRIEKLRKNSTFRSFFDKPITVNDKVYISLSDIEERINQIVPELLYDVEEFCIIHGDLCFTNIMIDNQYNFIKVIDPRGKFGECDIYGDPRYEIAKLLHSVDGKYDYVIKDQLDVTYDLSTNGISYKIFDRSRDFDLHELFLDVFKENIAGQLKKIELIESLLFLSMIPLHAESLDHQITMLAIGVDILNRISDITVTVESEENV